MRCYGLTLIQGSEFRFFHLPTTTRPINIPDSNSRFSFSNSNFFPSKLVSATFMTPVSLRITARAAVNDELMTEEVAVASGLSFYELLGIPESGRRDLYDRDLAKGLYLAFFARRKYQSDEEMEERCEWKNHWQAQVSEIKRRSMNKDAGGNLSWGA